MVTIKRLEHGITRRVFLIGPYAVKVVRLRPWRLCLRGLSANLTERSMGRMVHPALCPVLWGDPIGILLVMPRASQPRGFKERQMRRYVSENGTYRGICCEQKTDSFGFLGRRLVLLDYGGF